MGYWDTDDFNNTKPEAFLKVRPDGVAFVKKARVCAFLEFTRPMDSRDCASEQPDWYTGAGWSLNWAQDKDLEKNTRYARHLEYIGWVSKKGSDPDHCPIQVHGGSPRLRNGGCLGGLTH